MNNKNNLNAIAIIGTAGVPANYGGFETLADNLVKYKEKFGIENNLTVYCTSVGVEDKPNQYLGAHLEYVNLKANGISSVFYDVFSLMRAIHQGNKVVLMLGVSGAVAIPVVRLFSSVKILTNIDGIEWRREKWSFAVKLFLRFSEYVAVKFSNVVISDNEGIREHVISKYGRESFVIAYGGDHAVNYSSKPYVGLEIPDRYAFSLCRIEPENNIDMILEAFAIATKLEIVFVGNWNSNSYGTELRKKYSKFKNIFMLDPIYDLGVLRTLRQKAEIYIHGHSAGGTNPSLVEMMHFGIPVLAFDCIYNRYTTNNIALYFRNMHDLSDLLRRIKSIENDSMGAALLALANKRYTWDIVGERYFKLINNV